MRNKGLQIVPLIDQVGNEANTGTVPVLSVSHPSLSTRRLYIKAN